MNCYLVADIWTSWKKNQINPLIQVLLNMFQDVVYGAYGNANTDTIAYLDVGIRPNIVYLVIYFMNDGCKQFL